MHAATAAIAILVLILSGPTGCSGPARLDLHYPAGARQTEHTGPGARTAARFCFHSLEDSRGTGDEAGAIGGRAVTVPDARPWCETALRSLGSPEVRFSQAGVVSPPLLPGEIAAFPRLRKLHVESVTTSKAATIVIEIEFRRDGCVPVRRVYRGRDVAPNWISSTSETEAAFNAALQDCLERIRRDLQGGVEACLDATAPAGS